MTCKKFIQDAANDIEKHAKPGDLVFLASLRSPRLSESTGPYDADSILAKEINAESKALRTLALAEADELVKRFEKKSLLVMIETPKPVFKAPPFRCVDWFDSMNVICRPGFSMEKNFLAALRAPVIDSIEKLKIANPDLVVWDSFKILCPKINCSAFDGLKPLFYDGDHLSVYGNSTLQPLFLESLKTLWPL